MKKDGAIAIVKNFPQWNLDDQWLNNDDMDELTCLIIQSLDAMNKIENVVNEWSKAEYPYSNNHMMEIKSIINQTERRK